MRSEDRFTKPLYTIRQAASLLGVPASTLETWVLGVPSASRGQRSRQIVTAVSARPGDARIPFIGLAEGMVVAGFRRAGVSMQHIRKAVAVLEEQIGVEHALASRRLYTDGARILFDYAESTGEEQMAELTVVVNQQRVFAAVVSDYLSRIEYGADDWARRVILPITAKALVQADPDRAFGQPIFVHGAARIDDLVQRWIAGEGLAEVAADFGVPLEEAEDVLRAVVRPAA